MSETCLLGEVPASYVDPEKVKLAEEALEFWKKNYGGGEIKLRWMRRDQFSYSLAKIENALKQLSGFNQSDLERGYEEGSPTTQGFMRQRALGGEKSSSIFVIAEIPAYQIQRTCFHELYHKTFSPITFSAERNEADEQRAEKFAARVEREMAEEKKREGDERWKARFRELNSRR